LRVLPPCTFGNVFERAIQLNTLHVLLDNLLVDKMPSMIGYISLVMIIKKIRLSLYSLVYSTSMNKTLMKTLFSIISLFGIDGNNTKHFRSLMETPSIGHTNRVIDCTLSNVTDLFTTPLSF